MTKINIDNLEVQVAEGWDDLSIEKFVILSSLYEDNSGKLEEEFIIEFILIISDLNRDQVYSLKYDSLSLFTKYMENYSSNKFSKKEVSELIINDTKYSVVIPNELTVGEMISMKLLQKQATTLIDQYTSILCIFIRPQEEYATEFGVETRPIPFVADINILNKRRELFKNINCREAVYIFEAFQNGRSN